MRTEGESKCFHGEVGDAGSGLAISTRGVAAPQFVADQLVINGVVLGLFRHADTYPLACRSLLEIAHAPLPWVRVNEPRHALAVEATT